MIRDLFLAILSARCDVPCPATQDAIDDIARGNGQSRKQLLDWIPIARGADFFDFILVACGNRKGGRPAPLSRATGRSREEWLTLLNEECGLIASPLDCRNPMSTETTYDELALKAMLIPNKAKRDKRIAELKAHSEGRHTCPDCGSEGPHDVQHNGFEQEFACAGCGMQHPVPAIPEA